MMRDIKPQNVSEGKLWCGAPAGLAALAPPPTPCSTPGANQTLHPPLFPLSLSPRHQFMFATPDEDSPLKAVDFGISVFCEPGQYITARAGA